MKLVNTLILNPTYKKIFFSLTLFLYTTIDAFAGGMGGGWGMGGNGGGSMGNGNGGPGGGGGNQVPINNELWILLIAGAILGIYFLKKKKNALNKNENQLLQKK